MCAATSRKRQANDAVLIGKRLFAHATYEVAPSNEGVAAWNQPMPYPAVIFDLDGTLLDTLADIGNSANEVLERHGFPTHALTAYKTLVGDGVSVLFSRALPVGAKDDATIAACVRDFSEVYGRNWNRLSKPYDGILDMLHALAADGVKFAVLSNKPQVFTRQCVDEFFPTFRFDTVFGQREGIPRKPDPAGALEIAAAWNLPTSQVAYVGDTSVDMQTARSAAMFAIGATWGFRSRDELLAHGAAILIDHPRELFTWINK